MSLLIQSPAISNQLRQALSLDGAGNFGMAMEQVVLPVAIVADVRSELTESLVTVANWVDVAAVAAQYARINFQWWQNVAGQNVEAIYLDKLHFTSQAAQRVMVGIMPPSVVSAVNQTAIPQRKLVPAFSDAVAARLIYETAVGTMNVAQAFTILGVPANTTVTLDMSAAPIILNAIDQYVGIASTVVNVELRVTAEWRELRRG